jgi:hypothetical protein
VGDPASGARWPSSNASSSLQAADARTTLLVLRTQAVRRSNESAITTPVQRIRATAQRHEERGRRNTSSAGTAVANARRSWLGRSWLGKTAPQAPKARTLASALVGARGFCPIIRSNCESLYP